MYFSIASAGMAEQGHGHQMPGSAAQRPQVPAAGRDARRGALQGAREEGAEEETRPSRPTHQGPARAVSEETHASSNQEEEHEGEGGGDSPLTRKRAASSNASEDIPPPALKKAHRT